MSVTIETKKLENRFVISIPANEISAEEIDEIVSALKAEIILRKSELSDSDSELIAEDIKSEWWKNNEHRIKKLMSDNE